MVKTTMTMTMIAIDIVLVTCDKLARLAHKTARPCDSGIRRNEALLLFLLLLYSCWSSNRSKELPPSWHRFVVVHKCTRGLPATSGRRVEWEVIRDVTGSSWLGAS